MSDASAAPLRGGAVGSVTATLAVTAHGLAGGGFTDGSAVALLLVVSIGIGALTAVPRSTGARPYRSTALLVLALGGGQVIAHGALSLGMTEGGHHHSLLPTTAMLGFHAVASLLAALLIAAGERLYGPVTSIVRAVLALLTPLPDGTAVGCVRDHRAAVFVGGIAHNSVISRRGPPVSQF